MEKTALQEAEVPRDEFDDDSTHVAVLDEQSEVIGAVRILLHRTWTEEIDKITKGKVMRIHKMVLTALVVTLASSFVIGCAVEDNPENDPGAQPANLQQRVDDVLVAIPGGHQVSATEIDYDGLTVTFDPKYSAEKSAFAPASLVCSDGWFCIVVQGTTFSFFKCQMWDLSNWLNQAPFNNNQSHGTVARAYDLNFNPIWSNTARAVGDVNVNPWWHFKPC